MSSAVCVSVASISDAPVGGRCGRYSVFNILAARYGPGMGYFLRNGLRVRAKNYFRIVKLGVIAQIERVSCQSSCRFCRDNRCLAVFDFSVFRELCRSSQAGFCPVCCISHLSAAPVFLQRVEVIHLLRGATGLIDFNNALFKIHARFNRRQHFIAGTKRRRLNI